MVTLTKASIFDIREADAIVNPVNAVGVSGAGLALSFKERWPGNYWSYVERCKRGDFRAGQIFVYPTSLLFPRYIINAATKGDWRKPSRLEYIISILEEMKRAARVLDLRRIAAPKLGCGLGGLKWGDVLKEMERVFGPDDDVELVVSLYEEKSGNQNRRRRQNPRQA